MHTDAHTYTNMRGVLDTPTQSDRNRVGEDAGVDILQEPQVNLLCVLL